MSFTRRIETPKPIPSGVGTADLGACAGDRAPIAPSGGRKLALWLLVGMLSVICVEVPSGSTMFPFFSVWGLLVVWPLYLLHTLFLAGLVFRLGQPGFWSLYSAGIIYGMYEAYITKVIWVSFRPEGPFFTFGGIALVESIVLVLFLHPLLAFIVPLFMAELLLTNSREVLQGLPDWSRHSIQAYPRSWLLALMAMFGLMQFVNSPSPLSSLLSGVGNGVVLGLAVFRWRSRGGTAYSLRELLPGPTGLKVFGVALLGWYVFWGFAIKPKSIPPILGGQLTVWIIYAGLLFLFFRCLGRSRRASFAPADGVRLAFTWKGFFIGFGVATAVTTAARLWLRDFAGLQFACFLAFYAITGMILLAGAVHYAFGAPALETAPVSEVRPGEDLGKSPRV